MSNVSESSKASLTKSCASCASLGSSAGTPAKRANRRVSCSFCEEWRPGSSQTTITRPACDADVGLRHQRIGGDVEADVLHRRERANAGERRADRHVERDLLVGRPLGVDLVGGEAREGFEDLGRRRAGIGGGDPHARLPGAARDRLVAHQRRDLFRRLDFRHARLSVHRPPGPPPREKGLCAPRRFRARKFAPRREIRASSSPARGDRGCAIRRSGELTSIKSGGRRRGSVAV